MSPRTARWVQDLIERSAREQGRAWRRFPVRSWASLAWGWAGVLSEINIWWFFDPTFKIPTQTGVVRRIGLRPGRAAKGLQAGRRRGMVSAMDPCPDTALAEANGWLDAYFAGWVRALAPRVDALACTGVVLSIPVTEEIARVGGIVSGQALATLADTAMVIACARHFRGFRPVGTVTLDIQYLRPAAGDRVSCRAMVVRAGRSLVFTRAVLTGEPSGKDVATATATFALP